MRVALAQIISTTDPEQNLAVVAEQTRLAADRGAELVVFPEATMCRFGVPLLEIAEPLDGPWATQVRRIAAEAGVTVVAGMFTPGEGDRVRNTLVLTGPRVEASYDKIHLFDAFGYAESDGVTPGDKPVVLQLDGIGIGLATCYDLRFPALFARLADEGAQLVLVPASWGSGPGKREQWELLARARALDSTCFVAACDQGDLATIGEEPVGAAPTGVGHSMVVSPDGRPLEVLDAAPGLLVIDVDLDEVAEIRRRIPVLANRRI